MVLCTLLPLGNKFTLLTELSVHHLLLVLKNGEQSDKYTYEVTIYSIVNKVLKIYTVEVS